MIIKIHSKTYRSPERLVNQDDDMIRVTIDLKRLDWIHIRNILKRNEVLIENNSND